MIIPVNEKYRIASDSVQWMLQRRQNPNKAYPEGRWIPEEFYRDLGQLAERLVERLVMESDAVGMAEGLAVAKEASNLVSTALSTRFNVEVK